MYRKPALCLPQDEFDEHMKKMRDERSGVLKKTEKIARERLDTVKEMGETLERQQRITRSLLKSGQQDNLFSGFNGDEIKWAKKIDENPDEWVWVRAKYGIIGVPFPDGSSYCFAPSVRFPLYNQYKDDVHKSMNGEVRPA